MRCPQINRPRNVPALFGFVCLALVLLNGCGFHLRGEEALPPEMAVTYIQGDRFSTLYNDFRSALEDRGVTVAEDRGEATAVLQILGSSEEASVLTVDIGGKVQEVNLRQRVEFQVKTADGQVLLDKQSVSLNRDFVYQKNTILGTEREAELIKNELQRDVVRLGMLRLIAAGNR